MVAHGRGLHIVMLAAEAFPFAKAGGLGDVIGSLPKALEKQGARVTIVIPDYQAIDHQKHQIEPYKPVPRFRTRFGTRSIETHVHYGRVPNTGIEVFFIKGGNFFDREGIYDDPVTKQGYPDEMQRFIFFMKAALQLLSALRSRVDLVHCHDSHTGLVPALLRYRYQNDPVLAGVGTLFTIHNVAYQGIFPKQALYWAGIDDRFFYPTSPFEFWGNVNLMKIGIEFADVVNTVSRTYAREIQTNPEFGYGLEGVLSRRSADLFGIVNGVDYQLWNPQTDPLIPAHYSTDDLSGKAICKTELLRHFGLPRSDDYPLMGIVSRLVIQKGLDLIEESMTELASLGVRLVILGEGQKNYQELLTQIALKYPERVAVRIGFDNQLAHMIEAGCDMFLMPSRYEPCGLNQLYSLRYGTAPVVRATGGLADTVSDYNPRSGKGTGFAFQRYSSQEMMRAIRRALIVHRNPTAWHAIMQAGMSQDWSWDESAREYMRLYNKIYERRLAG